MGAQPPPEAMNPAAQTNPQAPLTQALVAFAGGGGQQLAPHERLWGGVTQVPAPSQAEQALAGLQGVPAGDALTRVRTWVQPVAPLLGVASDAIAFPVPPPPPGPHFKTQVQAPQALE